MTTPERDEELLEPNGDGTFRMTAACHRLMMGALKRSTRFLYYCKPARANTQRSAAQSVGDDT